MTNFVTHPQVRANISRQTICRPHARAGKASRATGTASTLLTTGSNNNNNNNEKEKADIIAHNPTDQQEDITKPVTIYPDSVVSIQDVAQHGSSGGDAGRLSRLVTGVRVEETENARPIDSVEPLGSETGIDSRVADGPEENGVSAEREARPPSQVQAPSTSSMAPKKKRGGRPAGSVNWKEAEVAECLELVAEKLGPLRDQVDAGIKVAFSRESFFEEAAKAWARHCSETQKWPLKIPRTGDSIRTKQVKLLKDSAHIQTGDSQCKPMFTAAKKVDRIIRHIEGFISPQDNLDLPDVDVEASSQAPPSSTTSSQSPHEPDSGCSGLSNTGAEARRNRRARRQARVKESEKKKLIASARSKMKERKQLRGVSTLSRAAKRSRTGDADMHRSGAIDGLRGHMVAADGDSGAAAPVTAALPLTLAFLEKMLQSQNEDRKAQREESKRRDETYQNEFKRRYEAYQNESRRRYEAYQNESRRRYEESKRRDEAYQTFMLKLLDRLNP